MLPSALCVFLLLCITGVAWLCTSGESFFSLTQRLPAEVLVVEGWIGRDGICAAAEEFKQGGYQYVVTTGVPTQEGSDRSNDAMTAEQELIGLGIPKDRIIAAPTGQIERQRTYESAVAAWKALHASGIQPKFLNVLTLGPHARRSRLVSAKVNGPGTQVGVIAFVPPGYETEPWWRSKQRTKCLLKEFVGYPFEVLLSSGRSQQSPAGR
jgi:DUF218 domain